MGFSGVQNFPTIGLFDDGCGGRSRRRGWAMSEVDMIARPTLDLLTTPYVFNEEEAIAMTKAAQTSSSLIWRYHGRCDRPHSAISLGRLARAKSTR